MAGTCIYGNELSGFINNGKRLDYLVGRVAQSV